MQISDHPLGTANHLSPGFYPGALPVKIFFLFICFFVLLTIFVIAIFAQRVLRSLQHLN